MNVRLFRPDEWERFREVRLRALEVDPGVFSSNLARERAHPESHWRGRLTDPECGVFAVLHGDVVIGMTGIYVNRAVPGVAELWGSWLEPIHRGQGHAAAMYAARITWAMAHPTVGEVHVSHRASNRRSKRANQAHGFQFTHSADRDWPDGVREPELCYVLALDKPKSPVARIWRIADRKSMPWKNGRGTTVELGTGEGWRLSMAPITEDGPFSVFPGIDRTLVLLEGTGLDLVLPDEVLELRAVGDLVHFPGEVAVSARLGAGPVRDVNLMVQRDVYAHGAEVVAVRGPTPLGRGEPLIAVALSGEVRAGGVALAVGEAVVAARSLTADGPGVVLVARLRSAPAR